MASNPSVPPGCSAPASPRPRLATRPRPPTRTAARSRLRAPLNFSWIARCFLPWTTVDSELLLTSQTWGNFLKASSSRMIINSFHAVRGGPVRHARGSGLSCPAALPSTFLAGHCPGPPGSGRLARPFPSYPFSNICPPVPARVFRICSDGRTPLCPAAAHPLRVPALPARGQKAPPSTPLAPGPALPALPAPTPTLTLLGDFLSLLGVLPKNRKQGVSWSGVGAGGGWLPAGASW